jgi:hypothetical protein
MIRFVPLQPPSEFPEVVYDVRMDGDSVGKLLATPELAELLQAFVEVAELAYAARHFKEA